MAEQVTNYKCPNCDGGLKFVGASGKLECEYCDSVFDAAEIEAIYAEKEADAAEAFADSVAEEESEWDTSHFSEWNDADGMKSYSCPSCAGQIICDETTAATFCPYCGNPSLIPGHFSGGLKPDYILPFKLDQNAAKNALQKHYKGKRFLPKCFTEKNKIESIKGVYVPFWLFDGKATADVVFHGTNTHSYRSGDYRITETHHYHIRRCGTVPFEMIPVDASKKIPDAFMDAIEPFDYSALEEFSSAYLPGFLADKYDVTAEASAERADSRAENTAVAAMAADVKGYGTCTPTEKNVRLYRNRVRYAWLPVYLLGTVWNGKNYLFAMNGQTGKLVGDLPVDMKKYMAYFWGITAAVTAVVGTLLYMII